MQQLKQVFICSSLLSALFFTACNNEKKEETPVAPVENTESTTVDTLPVVVSLSGTVVDTALTGTAKFSQHNGKVKLVLNISCFKLANKSVAVHLHEIGDCGDMGKMAHGHWNPTNKQHGKWGSASFHSGDIGNISLDAKGDGSLEMETDLWSIGGDSTTNILGRSVIIHSGVDDYTTQPTGNAGSRIGCGVIKR